MMREVNLLINTPQMHTAIMWSKDWSWSGQNMALLDKLRLGGEVHMFCGGKWTCLLHLSGYLCGSSPYTAYEDASNSLSCAANAMTNGPTHTCGYRMY